MKVKDLIFCLNQIDPQLPIYTIDEDGFCHESFKIKEETLHIRERANASGNIGGKYITIDEWYNDRDLPRYKLTKTFKALIIG